jgi:5-oxoprolinase (ATP-hydrolysing) subunit A
VTAVDLNADVGEGAGDDDDVLDLVTSASVACGVHAGDPDTMRRTLEAATRRGVVVGAHPSYPDRTGFGRRPLAMAPAQITDEVLSQVLALEALAAASGARVRFVKPHGALYLRMADDESCATAVAEAVRAAGDLVLLVPAGSQAVGAATAAGVRVATEAFADRAYLPDGRLAPRSDPGAVIDDPVEAARRAVRIAVHHEVTAVDGTVVSVTASSICVHGDTPGAAALATGVRAALERAGVTLVPFVT